MATIGLILAPTSVTAEDATAQESELGFIEFTYDTQEGTGSALARALDESGIDFEPQEERQLIKAVDEVRTKAVATLASRPTMPGLLTPLTTVDGYKNARLWGTPINDRRSWEMHSVLEHVQCTLGVFNCRVTDRRDSRILIDPGNTATRIAVSSFYFPSTGKIGMPTFTFEAWRNSASINGTRTMTPNSSGARTSVTLSHRYPQKANSFGYYVSGSYIGNGKLQSLKAGRTATGTCTFSATPVCKW